MNFLDYFAQSAPLQSSLGFPSFIDVMPGSIFSLMLENQSINDAYALLMVMTTDGVRFPFVGYSKEIVLGLTVDSVV